MKYQEGCLQDSVVNFDIGAQKMTTISKGVNIEWETYKNIRN